MARKKNGLKSQNEKKNKSNKRTKKIKKIRTKLEQTINHKLRLNDGIKNIKMLTKKPMREIKNKKNKD